MNKVKNLHRNFKPFLRLYITGFAMGTADLIPGVSGGTVAFLAGIYEELLYSIKTASGEFLRLIFKGKIRQAVSILPLKFLIPLALGLFSAVLGLSGILSYALVKYPQFIWAFFFGLVISSIRVVLKRVVKWDLSDKLALIFSAFVFYVAVGMVPVETSAGLPFIFLSGALAICAMILPGISGSFILLLIGKYQQILEAVTGRDFVTLSVFMAGCLVGLALFSRVLSWLFHRHHDISVAVLSGVMFGSVRKLWPWRETITSRINSHGVEIPLVVKNILPPVFDLDTFFVIMTGVAGAVLVLYLDRLKLTREQTDDVESRTFAKEHKESLKDQ